MNVGSLFSGIGGLDLGLARAGFRHVFFCESDAWRRAVLAHHWPGVPIYEDVAQVAPGAQERGGHLGRDGRSSEPEPDGSSLPVEPAVPDLLCGGFPCQDVSTVGRRAGLAGERSGLFHEFARIAESLRPRWLLVENVPGLLSSNGGRDFGVVLGTLADLGYGVGWRIVDSRFFGVPQRRRRVFIVGALADGDPRAAAERAGQVLAVGTRCPGHPATRREARQDVAGTLGGGSGERGWAQDTERMTFVAFHLSGLGSGGPDDNDGQEGRLVAPALVKRYGKGTDSDATDAMVAHTLTSEGYDASEDGTGRGTPLVAAPLSHGSNPNSNMAGRRREDSGTIAVTFTMRGRDGEATPEAQTDGLHPALRSGRGGDRRDSGVAHGQSVRRLTPTECERLQALPDGWTDFGPDSRRYAALGDAVTASVAEWIGRRIIGYQLMQHVRAGAAA